MSDIREAGAPLNLTTRRTVDASGTERSGKPTERIDRPVVMSVGALIKRRSAFLPVAMSLGAMVLLLWHVAAFGAVRQVDEGAAARVYQLLMAAQVPIVAYFGITWLPRAPRQALLVLALQLGAALLTLAPLFLLGL